MPLNSLIAPVDAESAQVEAKKLGDAVREHRRAASFHRRAQRRAKTSLVELQQMCDRAGITLRVETPQSPEGHSGERSDSTEGQDPAE